MNARPFLCAAALCSSALCAPATRADVKYLQETLVPGQEGKVLSTLTTYRVAGAERTEMKMSIGPMTMTSVSITDCARKQYITLDSALKIYYATPLSAAPEGAARGKGESGTVTSSLLSMRERGRETIGGIEAPVYDVSIRYQTAGCLGVSDTTTRQQIAYAAPVAEDAALGCGDAAPSNGEDEGDGCRTQTVRQGDWTLYDSAVRGVPLLMRILDEGGKVQSEMITRSISRGKLSPSLFVVPGDYKQVSKSKFESARQKAMMEGMAKAAGQ